MEVGRERATEAEEAARLRSRRGLEGGTERWSVSLSSYEGLPRHISIGRIVIVALHELVYLPDVPAVRPHHTREGAGRLHAWLVGQTALLESRLADPLLLRGMPKTEVGQVVVLLLAAEVALIDRRPVGGFGVTLPAALRRVGVRVGGVEVKGLILPILLVLLTPFPLRATGRGRVDVHGSILWGVFQWDWWCLFHVKYPRSCARLRCQLARVPYDALAD